MSLFRLENCVVNKPPTPTDVLRIGLLVDSLMQPRWIRKVIEDIAASSFCQIALVVRNEHIEFRGTSLSARWRRRQFLLFGIYTRLDNKITKVAPNAFELVDISDLCEGVPVLGVSPTMKKFTDTFPAEVVQEINKYRLDVALRFGFRILKGAALEIAKYGVWSYHHDDGREYRGGPPGFWEVMKDDPVTGSMLQVINEELDNGKVIYRSWAPTINRFSVRRNNNNYYWKSAAFVIRKLAELHREGQVYPHDRLAREGSSPYCAPLYKSPQNRQMFGLLWGLGKRAARRAIEKLCYSETWSLAYRFRTNTQDTNDSFYKFKYLIPPKGHFWADPFPVRFNGKYFVYFEDYAYRDAKAVISVIELRKDGSFEGPFKVLEADHQLSYPYIFEWNQSLYMIPETGSTNTVELFRCTSFPLTWQKEAVLLEADNPADATLISSDGKWWMFLNIQQPGMTVNWEELHLYIAATHLGPWSPHRDNPVKSDVRNSRPAGRPFYRDGQLLRPAQDSSRRYGYGTAINRVLSLSDDEYREETITTITPDWDPAVIGTHTLNSADDLTVIDCLRRSRRFFGTDRPLRKRINGSKNNVLQFICSFIQGGSERQMIQLTKLLRESGRYNVSVACLDGFGELRHEIDTLGLNDVAQFPLTSFYDPNMLTQLRRFASYLRSRNIQLVHTHDFYSNVFAITGAALARVPVRIASKRETKGLRSHAQKQIELIAFRLADAIVVNAEAVRSYIISDGVPEEKPVLVSNGLDLTRFPIDPVQTENRILEDLKLPKQANGLKPRFTTVVANMHHDVKDLPMFLRAARRVHECFSNAVFVLAGEGPLRSVLYQLAIDLRIADNTVFLGDTRNIPDLLSVSEVCVLSSKAEGFSNSILEYMAVAKPVVATDVGGAREAIRDGETGYLVASDDDQSMGERIISLLKNPDLGREMGRRGRQIVEEEFSCESQLQKTEDLYDRLLKKNLGLT